MQLMKSMIMSAFLAWVLNLRAAKSAEQKCSVAGTSARRWQAGAPSGHMMSHLWLAESAAQQGEQIPLARASPARREQICWESRERRGPPFTQKMLCFLQILRFSFALLRAGNIGGF